MIGKAAGELEYRFGGRVVADQFRRAFPANLDACKQIGFRPGEAVEAGGLELLFAENLVIGDEADRRASPVARGAHFFQAAGG